MRLKKIEKYIEYGQTKIKTFLKERKYNHKGYQLKYILETNESEVLVVILSGFTRKGIKARYNYNRTLKGIKVNKLFILDDFGYDNRGAYYLGHNMDFMIKDCVEKLVKETKEKISISKTFYVGSSKGGYTALYFGLRDEGSNIISGAPQYYLGNFLKSDNYLVENTLKYIVGEDVTDQKTEHLNTLLKTTIEGSGENSCKIFLHYSSEDFTYQKHIKYLIEDLENSNLDYSADVENYKSHSDVSLYFPQFLKETILENI